jgi:MATE family multidrug resistance protein
MVWHVLTMRGISVSLLKTAWRGNIRTLLALNRDISVALALVTALLWCADGLWGASWAEIVAVNAVLMTLLTFTAYALDGFAYAVEAHSGQAYGARESGQLRDVWRAACRQAGLVALAFALTYACFGEQIVALLTSLPGCVNWQVTTSSGRRSYRWWASGAICWTVCSSARREAEMRNSMAVAAAGFGLTLLTLRLWATTVCGWRWQSFLPARPLSGVYLASPLAA